MPKKRTICYCVLCFFYIEVGYFVEPRDANLFTWSWQGGGGVYVLTSFCGLVVGEWWWQDWLWSRPRVELRLVHLLGEWWAIWIRDLICLVASS